jgi:hypothetical protein
MLLAYIDPGSGALVWQMAIAALMGLLFYLGKVRAAIARGFSWLFRLGRTPTAQPHPKDAGKD